MLSCHPDGASYLPDGTTLAAYIAAHPGCLGTDCDQFEQFPILTEFIDAKQNLSVQVHPSNEYRSNGRQRRPSNVRHGAM